LRDSVVNLSEEVAAKDKEIADLKAHIDDLEAARGDGGVAATTNPLKALDAGAIVDLILQLKKSTVAAIVHDLTKETKAATEPKSEEPKATPTLKWKDLDARKKKMPIERHHFEAKTPTGTYGISMQGKGVGGLDFAGHNVHFRQGNGSPERIGHAGTLEQAKEIAQEHAHTNPTSSRTLRHRGFEQRGMNSESPASPPGFFHAVDAARCRPSLQRWRARRPTCQPIPPGGVRASPTLPRPSGGEATSPEIPSLQAFFAMTGVQM
jgi:hypothetical protein